MDKMKIRKSYDKRDRALYQSVSEQESLTEQHYNHGNALSTANVVKRFIKTGVADHLNALPPLDLKSVPDLTYQEILNLQVKGMEAFMNLPSKIRKAFDNDPAQYLDAFSNPEQAGKLRELGILPPEAVKPPADQPKQDSVTPQEG
jgi:Chlamydia-phage Chp2 scaffold (Chlamy_scaf).